MDPISITAAAFGIAGAVAKASTSVLDFSLHAKDAADDLTSVYQELRALNAILDPLARGHAQAPDGTLQPNLADNLRSSLNGCEAVVGKIEATIEKYQKDGGWTRTKWVMVGRGDMEKLRGSLEAYKMALGLGLQLITIAVEQSVKEDTSGIRTETSAIRSDTGVLRNDTSAIQVNTEEILARVMSIRNGPRLRPRPGNRTLEWLDSMAVLSTYAETTYQETVIDPDDHREMVAGNFGDEKTVYGGVPLDTVQEFDGLMLSEKRTGAHASAKASPRSPSPLDELDEYGPGANTPRLKQDSPTPESDGPMAGIRGDRGSRDESAESVFSSPSVASTFSSPVFSSAFSSPTLTSVLSSPATNANDVSFTVTPKNKRPLDLVIVLDVGNTSAAVGWMTREKQIHIIEEWPGGKGQRVPTMVVSDKDDNITSWGYQCSSDTGPGKFHHECSGRMKLGAPVSGHERMDNRVWLIAFLRELYAYVKQTVSSDTNLKRCKWEEMGIEFHFTLSDMFRSSETEKTSAWLEATRKFKDVIRRAGFGTGGRGHFAVLGPTETEAAAVAVIRQLPEDLKEAPDGLLNVGMTHATVVGVKRPDPGSPETQERLRSKSFRIPPFNSYIEEILSTWLKRDHPKIAEELGTDGVGPVACDTEFQDMMGVLDGSARLRESYRLHFEHLPKSRHKAFDIMDGTMKLSRKHVELILDGLVAKIGGLVLDSLNEILCPEDRKMHSISIIPTTETPLYLVELLKDGFEELQDADLKFRLSPSATLLGQRAFSAIEGILSQCNMLDYAFLDAPVVVLGPFHPIMYLGFPKGQPLKAIYEGDDENKGHQLFPFKTARQSFGITSNTKGAYDAPRKLSLSIYFSSDPRGRNTTFDIAYDPCFTKLCTATWTITPEDFYSFKSWRRKWYAKGANRRRLDCELQVCILDQRTAGPKLKLELATDEDNPRLAETVEWHCEPPYIAWARTTPVEE